MKVRSYLLLIFTMIAASASAQMSNGDVESFFKQADKNSVNVIVLVADIKHDDENGGYRAQRSFYKTSETTIEYRETCLVLKNSQDLIYIPYSSIRSLYKGKDGWGEQSEKGIIKIDLMGNSNVKLN